MNSPQPPQNKVRIQKRYVALLILISLPLFCAAGIAGYFRLGPETKALRKSMMNQASGSWDTKFSVHIGWFTMGLARLATRSLNLPPEPRAALASLDGVEVGVYELRAGATTLNSSLAFAQADKAMNTRGWERIVGVVKEGELVAVYVPREGVSSKKMACCVTVLQARKLVVVAARGNLEPLLSVLRVNGKPLPVFGRAGAQTPSPLL